jgi:hypothetical protein
MKPWLAAMLLFFVTEARAEETEHSPAPREVTARAALGGAYTRVVGLPFFGVSAEAGLGGYLSPEIAVYLGGAYARMETANGLTLDNGTLEAAVEGVLGRFRIGAGAGVALLFVHRVSEHSTLDRYGVNTFLQAGFDVWQIAPHHALYVALRPEGEIFSSVLARALLLVGARY